MKFDDAYIKLYEEFPCKNRNQLRKREGEVIRSTNCVNKVIAGQTKKEWREVHSDELKEKKKQYYQDNKERLLADCKERKKTNGSGKRYYEKHKTQVLKKQKEKMSEIVYCEACNKHMPKASLYTHNKGIKHIKWFIWH